MRACGLVVEYNPFHHGHVYHIEAAKHISNAECIIAMMSGPFLQRGEPAIFDKFHRAKAALCAGADIVLELPYAYAVQSSALFAKGAVQSLHEIGVDSLCFGSEQGSIDPFIQTVHTLQSQKSMYDHIVQVNLAKGLAFPQANQKAYEAIGIDQIDMMQPNNILGLSYVKAIEQAHLPIKPLTIKRIHNHYHDETISNPIASATSIRKGLYDAGLTTEVTKTLPNSTIQELKRYRQIAKQWHDWEDYFPFLHYKVMTMDTQQLAAIHGVDEGLENRLRHTAQEANSFHNWMERMKTKRYTQTRLQRMFVHLLTNTTKIEIQQITEQQTVPYLRLLGMTVRGRQFVQQQKKRLSVPLITNLKRDVPTAFILDERATNIYYAPLHPNDRQTLRKQEWTGPIIEDVTS